jgi:hypothetical protein
MKVPLPAALVDERFLMHRLRATSLGGIAGGTAAMLTFAWGYFVHHLWRWDMLAIALTIIAVKYTALIYFRLTD